MEIGWAIGQSELQRSFSLSWAQQKVTKEKKYMKMGNLHE